MRVVSRLLAFTILFFFTSTINGQWNNISAGKLPLGGAVGSGSSLVVRNGTIWAAFATRIWSSVNDGATWTNITPAAKPAAAIIYEADLFDASNGVMCANGVVYLTNNGGATWSVIQNRVGTCVSVKFVRNAQEIVCVYNSGPMLFTRNGGATWNTITPTGFTFLDHVVTRRTGEMAVVMNNVGGSRVAWTVNDGATWTNSTGTYDYDCWSMAIDSCDLNAFYVVNEELYARTDRTAGIYISTNKGQTFNRTASTANLTYFCGSVSTASGGIIFAQTISGGILRSNDNGATWVSIGGPNGSHDSRTISSISKDTIYAIDRSGDVWKTTNSGGFPVTANISGTLTITPPSLFQSTSTQLCDSLTRSFRITRGSCNPPNLVNVFLQGFFPGDYQIIFVSQDSVIIRFKPNAIGARNAQAVFMLSNGLYIIRDLLGSGIDSGYKVTINPNPLFRGDSVLTCKSVTRGVKYSISGCRPPLIAGRAITGPALGDYTLINESADSSTIIFDPSQSGLRQAQFTLQTSDGRTHSIPLLGVGIDPGPALTLTPPVLFGSDNIFYCRSVKRGISITMGPCAATSVLSDTIIGTASGDYIIIKHAPNQLTGKDSVTISFQPSSKGARDAFYQITLTDGTKFLIRLAGSGADPGKDLYGTPTVLFEKDTLLPCRKIARDLEIFSNLCVDRKILTQTITGNAAADYTLVRRAFDPLTGNDKVTIEFAPSIPGPRPALYELMLADSTKLSIPLRGYALDPGTPITITPSQLFENDSIALCTSITRGLRIKTNECVNRNVASQIITGSNDYTITQEAPNPLNGYDSVTITYTPSKPGPSDADFEFTLAYGTPIKIPLRGKAYDPGYAFSHTATSLFDADTIELCKSIERSFSVSASGCIVPKVKIKNITNDVLSEYEIVSNLPDSLTGADIVTIRFTPKALGLRTANFNIELTDGRSVRLQLNGYCINGPYILSVMPQDMFMSDSLFLCQDVEREVEVSLIGCAILRIASQEIRSTDSTAYQVVSKAGDSLSTNTVRVRFIPRKGGAASGEYVITLDDGRSVSIPLGGFGRAPVPLALSTTPSYHTDTLGGTFNLPIIINGLDRPQTIGLTISFDANLEYLGTTSARTNETLDPRRESNASPIHIILPSSHVIPNEISAYANFAVYADTVKPSFIHIDSLYVLTQDAPCQYITDTRTVTEVTGASGCGITIISDFLRYNKKPDLSIYPNPTSGALTIHSTDKLENVTVEVVDIVGQVRMTTNFTGSLSDFKMNVSSLPSGAYRIRLATQDNLFTAEAAVVVEK